VNSLAVVLAIARADFLERVRRYSFLFTLGFALYLGYLAIAGNLILQVGHVRGIFNSAWIGGLLSLVVGCFISLIGFYFIKNTIQRDRETRVGQILAATPISKLTYALGKLLSNVAVLTLMMAVVAASGIAMQLIAGEDRHILLWNLIAPFIFLAFPAMLLVAALAFLFESVPFLRGGFGNLAYFFLWITILSVPLTSGKHTLDLIGVSIISDSAREAAHLPASAGVGFSLSFGQVQRPMSSFVWNGQNWTPDILISRVMWIAVAFAVVALAALLFDRFDTSRGAPLRDTAEGQAPAGSAEMAQQNATASLPVSAGMLTPIASGKQSSRFISLVTAELRLMLKGQKWWWYTASAGLAIASGAVPSAGGRGMALAFAWIWPILLWSAMGVREIRDETYQLMFSAPHPIVRQLPAIWCAGVLVALITGCGFGLQALLTGNFRGLAAWLVGACFIPAWALALGVWSGTGKPFEILYTLLWYIGPLHAFPQLDFMGSAPATAATLYPLMYLAMAAALGVVALAGRKRQLVS
jgi:hypothetical protein